MNDAILRINSVPVYGFGILSVLAFLWGSFVFFKRSNKSNYDERTILDNVVLSAFWGFIVGRLVYSLVNIEIFWNHWSRLFLLTNYPGLDRFGVLAGIALGLWLCLRKIKGKFIDWFDLISLGISAGTSVFFSGLAILSFSWQFVLFSFLYLLVFIYFWNIEEKYRTFEWYRNNRTSSRSGFISGFSISLWGILFLFETILMAGFNWFSFLWASILLFGGLILVYIRSGRAVSDDIKIILKYGKK